MNIIERYERKFSTAAKNKTTNSLRTEREEILKNARRGMKEWASLSSLFNFLPVALRFLFHYYYRMPAGASVLFILLFSSFFCSSPFLSPSRSLSPFLCMYFSLNQLINKQSTQRANKRRRNNKSETRKICCNGHDLINVRLEYRVE